MLVAFSQTNVVEFAVTKIATMPPDH